MLGDNSMTKFFVYTQIGQKHRRELAKIIRDEAKAMEQEAEYDEYVKRPKIITCDVCELVEKTNNPRKHISVPMYADNADGGYIHVYGWKVKDD